MDNKQNREFYWEVKDFLGKKTQLNESVSKKPDSLKDSIKKMLVQENPLHTPISNRDMAKSMQQMSSKTINEAIRAINSYQKAVDQETPECKAFTRNLTDNPFSLEKKNILTEASQGADQRRQQRLDDMQQRRRQGIERSIQRKQEEETARKERIANLEKQRKSEREIEYKRSLSDADRAKFDTMSDEEKAYDIKQYGIEKSNKQQAEKISSEVSRLSSMDPAQMSDTDRGRLKLLQIQLRDQPTKERVTKLQGEPQGPTPTGGNISGGVENIMGVDTSKLPETSLERRNRETIQRIDRDVESVRMGDTEAKRRLSSGYDYTLSPEERTQIKDKSKISGTSMTYKQFRDMSGGKEYDPMSRDDQNLVRGVAGTMGGRFADQKYGSTAPESKAAQTGLSTFKFKQGQDEMAIERDIRTGESRRAVDAAQLELNKFRFDPKYREAVKAKERPSLERQAAAILKAEQEGKAQAGADLEAMKNVPMLSRFEAPKKPGILKTPELLSKPESEEPILGPLGGSNVSMKPRKKPNFGSFSSIQQQLDRLRGR
jgi:hypothetical protein